MKLLSSTDSFGSTGKDLSLEAPKVLFELGSVDVLVWQIKLCLASNYICFGIR